MTNNGKAVKQALEANDLSAVSRAVIEDPKKLSLLVRLAYNKDTLVGWRAILATGKAADGLVKDNSGFLRETCRKLLWSLSDESGGIGWSAPELLGEVVSADPRRFQDIIPLIAAAYEVEEDIFRAGVLYALGRIAEKAPELTETYQKVIIQSLDDKDPLVKFRGMRLVGLLWPRIKKSGAWSQEYCARIERSIKGSINDHREVWIYRDTAFISIVVKDEAVSVVKLIC